MTSYRWWLVSSLWIVVAVGCSPPDGSGGDSGESGSDTNLSDVPTSSDSFPAKFDQKVRKAVCEWYFSCDNKRRPPDSVSYQSKQDCLTAEGYALDNSITDPLPRPRALERAPGFEFDQQQAETCLARLERVANQSPCEIHGDVLKVCDDVYRPSVPMGEPCDPDWPDECKGNGVCLKTGTRDVCYGTCQKQDEVVGAGDNCTSSKKKCDDTKPLYCGPRNVDDSEEYCFKRRSRADGESCDKVGTSACEWGTTCRLFVDKKCHTFELAGKGEPCDNEERFCEVGTWCEGANTSGQATCTSFNGPGEQCSSSVDCRYDLFCADTGLCQPRKTEGAACEGNRHCRPPLECEYDESSDQQFCRQPDPDPEFDCELPDD